MEGSVPGAEGREKHGMTTVTHVRRRGEMDRTETLGLHSEAAGDLNQAGFVE